MIIDTNFDFRSDANGKDPDIYSPMLRKYHRKLWSKTLPSGHEFILSDSVPFGYLHHRSEVGEFILSSDSVLQTFTRWNSTKAIIQHFSEGECEAFQAIGYTIGGMMVFPANRIDGKMTINGARGFNRRIADRMDLTLECIRRHYIGVDSPLADTLARYSSFFSLFEDFKGYVEYFLLHDLVDENFQRVRFFTPFNDFASPAVPTNIDTYKDFRSRSIDFATARNRRIDHLGSKDLY